MYRVWIYFYSLMSCTLIIILCYYPLIKKNFAKNTHRAMLPARNYLYRFQLHHIATQIFFYQIDLWMLKMSNLCASIFPRCNSFAMLSAWGESYMSDWFICLEYDFGGQFIYLLTLQIFFKSFIFIAYTTIICDLWSFEGQKSDLVTEYVCVFIYIKDMISLVA